MRKKKREERPELERIDTSISVGLVDSEIKERLDKGYVNSALKSTSKSYWSIIRTNIFTLFNGLNLLLGILVLVYGDIKNALFLGIVTVNVVIGIIRF